MAKMSNKLIALCSAAISTIYISGFTITNHYEMANKSQNDFLSYDSNRQSRETGDIQNNSQKKYKDGTYIGTGRNRIGSVEVAVTIKNDEITSVEITNCHTHYPQLYIDGLPKQVIERQSENVDVVSGATKSSEDFRTAVHQALLQARLDHTNQAISSVFGNG